MLSEVWVRVSRQPVAHSSRISIVVPQSAACPFGVMVRLASTPSGLVDLRAMSIELIHKEVPAGCNVDKADLEKANYVLIDYVHDTALVVGEGTRSGAERALVEQDSLAREMEVQTERLNHWMRALPNEHGAWAVITHEAGDVLRDGFFKSSHVLPAPMCVGQAPLVS